MLRYSPNSMGVFDKRTGVCQATPWPCFHSEATLPRSASK